MNNNRYRVFGTRFGIASDMYFLYDFCSKDMDSAEKSVSKHCREFRHTRIEKVLNPVK